MSSLSELALKGHFEQLKNKFEKKGMAKAGQDKDMLLKALKKAIATIEDIYEKYPDSLTKENRSNYISLIETLRKNGSVYSGHPGIMEKESEKDLPSKKPMQKARNAEKPTKKQRKTG